MRKSGYGYSKIAGVLNSEGILSPREYEYQSIGKDYPYPTRSVWLTKSVKTILHNESYIGNRVQLKLRTVSYKIPQVIKRPEDEWIRVNNAHEAIITPDTWEAVQAINNAKNAGYNASPPRPRLFRGMLRCPDCGSSFTIASSNNYQCIRFQQTASVECSSHFIKETVLKQILLNDIKTLADSISINKESVISGLLDKLTEGGDSRQGDIALELAHIRTRLTKTESKLIDVFEDRLFNRITKETYAMMSCECDDERNALASRQLELLEEQTTFEVTQKSIQQWVKLIKRYAAFNDVDRELLEALVDKIEIGKREGAGNFFQQSVRIFYKFVGAI